MRPDVAEAFDRMAAAARRDGLHLVINSGFRSDAEQAELFEQNPNPTMVAPPGKSLHRCATELDLGPPSAYGWLAQHARRFGFLKRYSWEGWRSGRRFLSPPILVTEWLAMTDCGGDTERAMSQENVELVREAFESFLGGDLEKAAQLVDPEVEFHGTVGGLEEGRVAHGLPQAFQTFWGDEDLEAWDERRLEPEEFIDGGDDVVVLLHEYRRGRRSGIELETDTAVVVAVSGGRVVRIQGYMDRHAALEAAGLRE